MSDLNKNHDDNVYVAKAERDTALLQRDVALDVAANQAQERDAAAAYALTEADLRKQAENQAVDARIAANQNAWSASQATTERNMMRENLAAERESASNANFGFVLLTCIVLAALIGLGIWYYTNQNTPTPVNTAMSSGTSSSNTGNTPSTGAATSSQPTSIHVNPAPVIVNPPANPPAQAPNVNVNVTPPSSGTSTGSGSDTGKNSDSDTGSSDSNSSGDNGNKSSDNGSNSKGSGSSSSDSGNP